MPAITRKAAGKQLEKVLQNVLNTEPNEWNYFFSPHRINEILTKLADQIQHVNFFTEDYSINKFLDFLKAYVKSELIITKSLNVNTLQHINDISRYGKDIILQQTNFFEKEMEIATKYLNFIHIFLKGPHRYLLEENKINFKMDDLTKIAVNVVKNKNNTGIDFIYSYLASLKLSFDIKNFLLNYQNDDIASSSIVSLGKILFLQQETEINLVIPHLFSALAYEFDLIDYYKNKFELSYAEQWQEKIILAATDLQQDFFKHLNERNDVSREGLKHYFFKYFLKEAKIKNPLQDRYTSYLAYYSNENFTPLPFIYECPKISANNTFVIEHAGLATERLEIVCQAKQCAERNHAQWLNRLGINQDVLPTSHYIYRIFNETRYDKDLYHFVKYQPESSGFYMSANRNQTVASGMAYVKYRYDSFSWWLVSSHEFLHHLNFVAVGNLMRSMDEGISYLLLLTIYGDKSYQYWLNANLNNYTSLALLNSTDFIGYNPSFLLMSYLVDTNPPIFAEILKSDQTNNRLISEKINQLINQDRGFVPWLNSHLEKIKNYKLRNLGEGDNYCPPFLKNSNDNQIPKNLLTRTTIMPSIIKKKQTSINTKPNLAYLHNTNSVPALLTEKKLTADEMGRELIFKISRNKLDEFNQLLRDGANANYQENGKTLLHYLYYYSNCDIRYLESLLKHGAIIIPDKKGLFPYQEAEKNCNATELQTIKDIFTRYAPTNLVTTSKPNETGLIPYQPKEYPLDIDITILIPILATINGSLSAFWDLITQKFPRLENTIFYALKPVSLAMTNAIMNILFYRRLSYISSEDAFVFSYYLGMNYLGMLSNQLGKKATKNIQNVYSNFFLQSLLNTFFTNPSLLGHLVYEGIETEVFSLVLWPMLSMIVGGVFFQAGEWVTQKVIGKFITENSADSASDSKNYFLRYSLEGTPKRISEDQKTLQNIQKKLKDLTIKIKASIQEQAYKLNFEANLISAAENISTLIEEISKEEQNIDREEYKKRFKWFEENLDNIQRNLNLLNSKKTKIKLLWDEVTQLLISFRGIRPLPQINISPDLVTDHKVTIEEEQYVPLMTPCTNGTSKYHDNPTSHYQTPTKLGKMLTFFTAKSDFPPPPTDKELLEMEDYPRGKQLHG